MFYAALLSVCFLIANFDNYCFLRIVDVCICEHHVCIGALRGRKRTSGARMNLQECLVLLTLSHLSNPFTFLLEYATTV